MIIYHKYDMNDFHVLIELNILYNKKNCHIHYIVFLYFVKYLYYIFYMLFYLNNYFLMISLKSSLNLFLLDLLFFFLLGRNCLLFVV